MEIKESRLKKKLSQLKLALLSGVSPATVWRAENGYSISSLSKIRIYETLELENVQQTIDTSKK